ncbi:MAG: hypothetical protein MUC29_01160 [Pyrinomonadaceae bacterium]|jgi:hypothetical protein|nr:hypothetical protein [Pyrinomonadaceae bacterium]
MKLKVFFLIIVVTFFFSNTFGQSCGGGNAIFHIFDENDIEEIKDFNISFHIVSEDQNWQFQDFSKFSWKQQIFDKKTLEKGDKFKSAFEISATEYWRLIKEREQILIKKPKSFVSKEIDRCNYYQKSFPINLDKPFTICVTEGCNFMVVAQVQAKGYETAYYLDNFACGCSKSYKFNLQRKRNKCLPK